MFRVFIELLPEAMFFSLFMILAKNIKENRVLFVSLTCLEYLLLFQAFPFSMYSKVGFFIVTFIILKMLYREKSQITDVFLLGIASLFLVLSSLLPSFLFLLKICRFKVYVIINRIIIFGSLFLFRNQIKNIQKFYKKLWNRNDKVRKKIKSTTFRSANLVLFNLMFFIINCGLAFAIYFNNK